jgi:XRE family transcriptional regulator, regulator of sulfur utilization
MLPLNQLITETRKRKGLTQETLADKAGLTIRTIQRIESGENIPRSHTLKAIAHALEVPFDTLVVHATNGADVTTNNAQVDFDTEETKHFLRLFNLSCFFYLVVPFVHFIIPMSIFKKKKPHQPAVAAFGRKVIQSQIYWVIATHGILLATLLYNFIVTYWFNKSYYLHYLVPFFAMYIVNAIIILVNGRRIKQLPLTSR